MMQADESAGGAAIGVADPETVARLRLARTARIGPATYLQLMRRYKTAERALDALPTLAARSGRRPPEPPSERAALAEIAVGQARGATLTTLGDPDYPALLAEIDPPPPALWVLGDPARLTRRAVAIVGARNASALGQRFGAWLAGGLAEAGLLIVSGLARGIDAAAHRGALDVARPPEPEDYVAPPERGARLAEIGRTAAVVAGGVDHIYPPEHDALHAEIEHVGALVSEAPLGAPPTAAHFRRRNRLISGLALGVVVVEGGERSGSLITANAAADQGREAFAAPGHPMDPRSAGCNRLIREGATLIRSPDDVLEALAPRLEEREPPTIDPYALFEEPAGYAPPEADAARGRVVRETLLGALSVSPTPLDALARTVAASEAELLWALTELEIAGLAARDGPGRAALDPDTKL